MSKKLSEFILLGTDALLIYFALLFSPALIPLPTSEAYPWPGGLYLSIPVILLIMLLLRLFSWTKSRRRLEYFLEILKAHTIFVLICAIAQSYYLIKPLPHPVHLALLWLFLVLGSLLGILLVRLIETILLRMGYGVRRVLIYGTGREAKHICERMKDSREFEVVGLVGEWRLKDKPLHNPILGLASQLRLVLVEHKINDLIIAQQHMARENLLNIINDCVGLDISIRQVPDLYDIVSRRVKPYTINGLPLKDITSQPLRGYYYTFKRLLDILFSLLGMIFLVIVILTLYFPLRIQSRGSLLYKQKRVGQDGKEFTLYKLRSMYVDAEEKTGEIWAKDKDPRITPIGRLIRRTRLDELTQLINVLRGEMSFIGPRPERTSFVARLSKRIPMYRRRLLIKPGITGWAQVKHKYDETLKDVEEKLKYDLYYIDNMTLWLDIEIFFRTIVVMLTGRGAK